MLIFQQRDAAVGDDHGVDGAIRQLVIHGQIVEHFFICDVAGFLIQLLSGKIGIVFVHAVLHGDRLAAEVFYSGDITVRKRHHGDLDDRRIVARDDRECGMDGICGICAETEHAA